MKKSLIAMVAVAMFATSAMAQVLIYDYSVSYKLVSASLKKNVKCDYASCTESGKVRIDSPKVASSKLTGYMVINACTECGGSMEESTAEDNTAVFYFANKSDKKSVYRSVGTISANMFSANTAKMTTGNHVDHEIGFSKFSDASGRFQFPLDFALNDANYGFLGFDTLTGTEPATVMNYGYGKVYKKVITTVESHDCDGDTKYEVSCWTLKNLSGNTDTTITYTGTCSELLFDICALTPTQTAPFVGSFSLKLNESLTKSIVVDDIDAVINFRAAEAVILNKMKVEFNSEAATVYVPESDTDAAALNLRTGTYWTAINE